MIDLDKETRKLRNRSAFRCRRIPIVFAITVVISGAIFATYFLRDELRQNQIGFSLLILGVFIAVIGLCITLTYFVRISGLIKNGVVVCADVEHVTRWPRGSSTVAIAFDLNTKRHKKTIYMPTVHADVVQNVGYLCIVVRENRPKIVEPLHMFAYSIKECEPILRGERGLKSY